MMERRAVLAGVIGGAALTLMGAPRAAAERRPSKVFTDIWGRALGGYDCVSYYADGGPRLGVAANELLWNGAAWRFATMDALKSFAQSPHKFAPLCGGYCVQSLAAYGRLVPSDATVWDMVDNRLVLFSAPDMRAAWGLDPAGGKKAAIAAWKGLF